MATKLERISRLALETSRSITSSTKRWKGFLDSAAWLYKYPFRDQVLIHAQKPEATACAEIALWNERLHRWVNRGAKGIALIDTSEEKPHLRYVFDVSDTNSRQNIPFSLWQAKPEMYPRIAEELQNSFGELGDTTDPVSVVFGTVMNAVMDNAGDYLDALRREVYGSSLKDQEELDAIFQTNVADSVAYTVLKRLGFDPNEYIPDDDFEFVSRFDTLETVSRLGEATADISEMILRQIERTVRAVEKESRDILAKGNEIGDTTGENSERSNSHGTDLYASGRLSDPEPGPGQPAVRVDRQVRTDAEAVSGGEERRDADGAGPVRQTDAAPHGDQQPVSGADRDPVPADGAAGGRERTSEGVGPDDVDAANEQHPEPGGGDRGEQPGLQLNESVEPVEPEEEIIDQTEEAVEEAFPASLFETPVQEEQFKQDAKRVRQPTPQLSLFEIPNEEPTQAEEVKLKSIVLDLRPSWEREQPKQEPVLTQTASNERIDFRITDDHLGEGGAKTKFQRNVAAIRTLKQIESEYRLATPEEQEILSQYVGWGGLPDAFDESKPQWSEEYAQLKELLTPDEYRSARASTLNAHYTSPTVIRAMYQAIESMGFRTGNILEPSCGIGNFFGMLPESMADSKLYGVELDDLTGKIARQLYQKANIQIDGFEDSVFPDSFFDVAIGNVPFGDYSVADKRYDKNHFLIHDYFFAKALDKVRPGGVVAFVTSSGTMDKANPFVRKYLSQRAELLGAIRLPNNAFRANAGTDVVADILFLQKRDHPIEVDEDWLHVGKSDLGYPINEYFLKNPDMILGDLAEESTRFGMGQTVNLIEGADLGEQLRDAIANIHGEIVAYEQEDALEGTAKATLPADPSVRNFSYTLVDGEIYFRENSVMSKIEVSLTAQNRIRGMIAIRDCVHKLMGRQLDDFSDAAIADTQRELNTLYNAYTAKYGLLNSRGNSMSFSDDSSYPLLCSLEVLDENGKLERKADMFTKRTIRPRTEITHVDTAAEALTVSLSEKAKPDLAYMAQLTGKTEDELETELTGLVFRDIGTGNPGFYSPEFFDPKQFPLVTADEFLSGNVRKKLATNKAVQERLRAAGKDELADALSVSIAALEKVQPKDLTASEISVRLGATWIPEEDIKAFVFELLQPGWRGQRYIQVRYSDISGEWRIEGKNSDSYNVSANVTYGTKRVNAYDIIEDSLNLKDVRVYDTVVDEEGREKRVLNMKETILAQQKQTQVQEAFRDWLWKDPNRRDRLTAMYNERFNSSRPREFDGSHLVFPGMNPEIDLRPHQVNAIARVLYGGNTLLAHVVGAGKTFEMTAAAMESKRLGLCHKSLIVVPNHLTEQWASEFLQLYPSANILVATKKDFEKQNRRRFCSRIATGDYDAVIIGHSQFEKIPLSLDRQIRMIEEQIEEITAGIEALEAEEGSYYSVKQMEKTKRGLETKLQRLNDRERKDDVVTFEELGVDRLFIDEAHNYKNLFLYTKMRNVAGIAQTEAQKSSDLYMKCRYLDEITDSHGVVFATGTPISNSMTEMYTMQRYLQYDRLRDMHLQHFDAWASTFGETVTAIELAPEGTGYRAKTRFARFFNLPELITMFKDVADVQTADMLKLPVPEVEYHNQVMKPSDFQREMVSSFAERAEKVRNGSVTPSEDNMLKITNDGRKLALDQRLNDPMLPDDDQSKVNACLENVYRIWEENADQRSAQLVFCDLSTPHNDGNFNVYDDMRRKLIERGVPEEEIAFIHEANTEARKAELFANVRAGKVRILLGSTAKMGAGTNVQKRLIALHHLDIPWRPSDIEQREGRILRQGNDNPKVEIFRYVTENTFDSYMWQTVENKQRFIGQIMTSKSPARSCEDVDETALNYAEVKALATGNPHIKEKMDLEVQVAKLKLLKSNYLSTRYSMEDRLLKQVPRDIRMTEESIAGCEADAALYAANEVKGFAGMTVSGFRYGPDEKKEAGMAILAACAAKKSGAETPLGNYMGFDLFLSYDLLAKHFEMRIQGALSYRIELGEDVYGNITRMDNALSGIPDRKARYEKTLTELHDQERNLKAELEKPFTQEDELKEKTARLTELDAMLNLDKHKSEAIGEDNEDRDRGALERSDDEYER